MGYLIGLYLVYGLAAVALTNWLARTLYRNGGLFLEDVFEGRPELARAVNKLLVVGFYMLNLGYALLLLRSDAALTAVGAIEVLSVKLGWLLVSLSAMHFVNLLVFAKIRRRARLAQLPPPLAPQAAVAPAVPWPPPA